MSRRIILPILTLCLLAGCTQLNEKDRALLSETHKIATEARDASVEARNHAAQSARAARQAEAQAKKAATDAYDASDRSERIFNKSQGK